MIFYWKWCKIRNSLPDWTISHLIPNLDTRAMAETWDVNASLEPQKIHHKVKGTRSKLHPSAQNWVSPCLPRNICWNHEATKVVHPFPNLDAYFLCLQPWPMIQAQRQQVLSRFVHICTAAYSLGTCEARNLHRPSAMTNGWVLHHQTLQDPLNQVWWTKSGHVTDGKARLLTAHLHAWS